MRKSVVVVEDDPGLREQLVKILRTASDLKCVAAFASGEEAVIGVSTLYPDVVLMDIGLPGMSGIQCVSELKRMNPALQIIMVTIYEDSERIFKALRAGASGYLLKSCPPSQLLDSVRDVFVGGVPMSSHIARNVAEHFHLLGPLPPKAEPLSDREQQVLDLIAEGLIYKEIGDKLDIAVATVRTHVQHICQKMHVSNRMEAVVKQQSELR